jgi:hypothetical protein
MRLFHEATPICWPSTFACRRLAHRFYSGRQSQASLHAHVGGDWWCRPWSLQAPVPDTDATRLLPAFDVRPAQQIELAGLPDTVVEHAIADGRARQGIRDLAGWVVYVLRQRRDHGWSPPPPVPRVDAPETLGTYFRQLVKEQAAGRETVQAHEHSSAERSPEVLSPPAQATPPPKPAQPSLAELWQDTLASLRLRLPREVYQTCVRQATLISYVDGSVTIGVADRRTKDLLEYGYLAALRFAFGDALGREVEVRIVIEQPTGVCERH